MMNNPKTNLGISVANLGVANLGRMKNTIPSKDRMNNLIHILVNVARNNHQTVQKLDQMDHLAPEDRKLLVDTCTPPPPYAQ